MEDFFRIGSIASTHGVHGEVKVYPTTDDVNRFKKCKEVILERKNDRKTVHIESVKFFKQMVIVKFQEYNTMDEAELLRGGELYVTRENAVPLGKNEYYVADLIGLKVITEEDQELGFIDDVMQTGANDVYIVKTVDDRELLIPAIKDCVKEISIDRGMMKIHVMEGLFD